MQDTVITLDEFKELESDEKSQVSLVYDPDNDNNPFVINVSGIPEEAHAEYGKAWAAYHCTIDEVNDATKEASFMRRFRF